MHPPTRPPRSPVADVVFAILVALLGGGVVSFLLRGLVFGFDRWRDKGVAGPDFLLLAGVSSAAFLGAALLFARPAPVAALRLGRPRGGGVALAAMVLGTFAIGSAAGSALVLLGMEDSPALVEQRGALAWLQGPAQIALGLALLAVLAGFAEELFFRGFVQGRLRARWGPRVGILIAAVLFGLAHFDRAHTAHALVLGLWLGFVAERAESVWPAILGHVANNAFAVLVHTSAVGEFDVSEPVTLVVSTSFAIGCALLILRALPRLAPAPALAPAQG